MKFATESDSKADKPDDNKADDADEDDEGSGNEGDKGISSIRRTYKLLGSVIFLLLIMNTDQSDDRSHYKLSSYRKVWWQRRKMVVLFNHYLLVHLLTTSNHSIRNTPAPDLTLPTYNITGQGHWVSACGTARQLYFLHGSTLNYTERGRSN